MEFHEPLKAYQRLPLSLSMLEQCKSLLLPYGATHAQQKKLEEYVRRGMPSFAENSGSESSDSLHETADEAEGPGDSSDMTL